MLVMRTGGKGQKSAVNTTPRQRRVSEIEMAKVRLNWAKFQIESGNTTPALKDYLRASSQELAFLKAKGTDGLGSDFSRINW